MKPDPIMPTPTRGITRKNSEMPRLAPSRSWPRRDAREASSATTDQRKTLSTSEIEIMRRASGRQ